MAPVIRGAGAASRRAIRAGAAGALWAKEHGSELLDRIPTERIDGFVQHELRDLRRALRRQRKRLGI